MPTHDIWASLPAEFSHQLLLDVQKSNKKLYRTVTEVMAPRMGLRVPILLEMPKTERHAHWTRILTHPAMEALSFQVFSSWLIETQPPLLRAWLDALGIAHDGNGCADKFPEEPSTAQLQAAVDTLLAQYDAPLVALYLRTFNDIDEVHWKNLEQLIVSDPRLLLQAPAGINA